jgi:hypothetical protein
MSAVAVLSPMISLLLCKEKEEKRNHYTHAPKAVGDFNPRGRSLLHDRHKRGSTAIEGSVTEIVGMTRLALDPNPDLVTRFAIARLLAPPAGKRVETSAAWSVPSTQVKDPSKSDRGGEVNCRCCWSRLPRRHRMLEVAVCSSLPRARSSLI